MEEDRENKEINSVIKGMKADYTCSECGHLQKVNILPYINFTDNPEYYALVMNLDIFKVKCDKCGKEKIIQFDTLIANETHKYFLYLLSDKSLSNKFKYQVTYFVETVLNKDDKYDLSQYKTRLVFTPNELIEKMSLFETGLDDEVIELIKEGMFEKGIVSPTTYDKIYFDGMKNADLEFVAISTKSTTVKPTKYIMNHEFYNKVIDDTAPIRARHRDYFESIDSDWVKAKFNFKTDSAE
jgi:transcription elongation factor Elf1